MPEVMRDFMPETFGQWLTRLREERGIRSQRELARKAKVASATVSKLEDDLVGASPVMVRKLADALQVDPEVAFDVWVKAAAASQGVELAYLPIEQRRRASYLYEKLRPKQWDSLISHGETLIEEDAIGATERNEERLRNYDEGDKAETPL